MRRYPSQLAAQAQLASIVAVNTVRVAAASDAAVVAETVGDAIDGDLPNENSYLKNKLQEIEDRLAAVES